MESRPHNAPRSFGEEDVFIETGAFSVDKEKALEKIRSFQLPDPSLCLLPWIRCAVAGKASEISFRTSWSAIEMRFDGQPFSRLDLASPYAGLFEEESEDRPRRKHLALGLLSLLRGKPVEIALASGQGAERHILRVASLGRENLAICREPDEGTVLRVSLRTGFSSRNRIRSYLSHVRACCQACPIPVRVDGREIPRTYRPEDQGVYFEEDEAYGWLGMRHEFSPLSPIAFYACGTLSEIIQLDLFHGARIRGYINDDRLALDASQSGVARNTRYGTLVEILNRQAQGLILATIEAHSQSFPQTGRLLLEPAAARIWQERFQHGIAAETAWGRKLRRLKMAGPIAALFGYDVARRAEFISRIHKDARTTLWLRALSSNSLSAYDKDRTDPALKALWEAPVFFGTFGESISRLDIANMNHRLGYVRYSLRPSRKPAAAGSTRTLWVLTGNDKHCLADLCGNKLRDVLLDPT